MIAGEGCPPKRPASSGREGGPVKFSNELRLASHPPLKKSVYVIQSETDATRYYTGLTSNVAARLAAHNAGRCTHTASGRPWKVVVIVKFLDEARAVRFERYLKSGSGVAFAKRHLR